MRASSAWLGAGLAAVVGTRIQDVLANSPSNLVNAPAWTASIGVVVVAGLTGGYILLRLHENRSNPMEVPA